MVKDTIDIQGLKPLLAVELLLNVEPAQDDAEVVKTF